MRTSYINSATASFIMRNAENETGSEAPAPAPTAPEAPAQQPEAEKPAKPVSAKRKAAAAKLAAKHNDKRGKRGKQASAVTEAKPDRNAEKQARIAADRSSVNALYAAFEANRASVPVKPLSAFKPQATTAHPNKRGHSVRQASAIALAFAASGKKLAGGGTVSRIFELRGIRSCIENGAMRDAVSSGLITVSGDTPETERLTVSAKAATAIIGLIGSKAANIGKLA